MYLIPTNSTIAIRCAACGELEFHTLSLFDFAGTNLLKLECSCGKSVLQISTKDRKKFCWQIECPICETKHLLYLSRKQIWSDAALSIFCEENGVEIGYVGPNQKVLECVERDDRSISDMAEELGYADYFDNPDIMYEVLDRLYEIAESGQLKCNCGNNDIAIEIFPDYLELRCECCKSYAVIMAATEQDLEIINNLDEIHLTRFPFKEQNGKKNKHHHKKSKKGFRE